MASRYVFSSPRFGSSSIVTSRPGTTKNIETNSGGSTLKQLFSRETSGTSRESVSGPTAPTLRMLFLSR